MSRSAATLRVRVSKKTIEATEVCSFELLPADEGQALPAFAAGAHIDVQLGAGLVRQYSLCNDPAESHRYLIAVLRDAHSRGGSQAMHSLQVGDTLTIGTPRNHFPLADRAQRSLLLAGGIGVTPILCMAEQLAGQGDDFEMHYCSRSIERTAFVARIAQAPFADRVQLHFDDGDAAQKLQLAAVLGASRPGRTCMSAGRRVSSTPCSPRPARRAGRRRSCTASSSPPRSSSPSATAASTSGSPVPAR